ncbi:MAG: DUF4846 domain-containing protein [Thermoanaerobaculales bacterium]|nr:DUF4846 domain-containing protein [Thermoanaerobaculales bacterium]
MKNRFLVQTAGIIIVVSVVLTACAQAPETTVAPRPELDRSAYPWLVDWGEPLPDLAPLEVVFPAPSGTMRVVVGQEEFAAWLRGLPVRLDRTEVVDYVGRRVRAAAAAVVLLDLGRGDLQQCADMILRLHAEYLWASGHAVDACYHFTSGDLSSHEGWLRGDRFVAQGRGVQRIDGGARPAGHAGYRSWLQHLFVYAGTLSLGLDSVMVEVNEPIRPGDFFVTPGSPGHAVIVLDVVQGENGSLFGLIGQGFTPAQELHIIQGAGAGVLDGAWFPLPSSEGDTLDVPTWTPFPRRTCRRFGQE